MAPSAVVDRLANCRRVIDFSIFNPQGYVTEGFVISGIPLQWSAHVVPVLPL
jgi:hypothetical protein